MEVTKEEGNQGLQNNLKNPGLVKAAKTCYGE